MRVFVVSLLLLGCVALPAAAQSRGPKAKRVVAKFGGECGASPSALQSV